MYFVFQTFECIKVLRECSSLAKYFTIAVQGFVCGPVRLEPGAGDGSWWLSAAGSEKQSLVSLRSRHRLLMLAATAVPQKSPPQVLLNCLAAAGQSHYNTRKEPKTAGELSLEASACELCLQAHASDACRAGFRRMPSHCTFRLNGGWHQTSSYHTRAATSN